MRVYFQTVYDSRIDSSENGCFTEITVKPWKSKVALTEQHKQKQTIQPEPERRGDHGNVSGQLEWLCEHRLDVGGGLFRNRWKQLWSRRKE